MLREALQELADDWVASSPLFGHCKSLFVAFQVFAQQSTEEFYKNCGSLGTQGRRTWLESQIASETTLDVAFGVLTAYANAFGEEPPQEEPTSTMVDALIFFTLRVQSATTGLGKALQGFLSSESEESRLDLTDKLRDAGIWVQQAWGVLATPGVGRNSVSVEKLRDAVYRLGEKCSAASSALSAALQRKS
ncbi:hypothetical protein, conserved [Eimeria necatrix]|uniref:Uncharacterized protein n=1 Tax=Eimeria necatrix TaxID=51315 RepID=U6MJE7_9EIME|nr:hypothetical protein, conserved [Eimeria necatrix]CDJ62564.1 hypothetical protein, conserved [Eimeria necatrix]